MKLIELLKFKWGDFLSLCRVHAYAVFAAFRRYRVWMLERLHLLCWSNCLMLPISTRIHSRCF